MSRARLEYPTIAREIILLSEILEFNYSFHDSPTVALTLNRMNTVCSLNHWVYGLHRPEF
jgi:hypothetical protein